MAILLVGAVTTAACGSDGDTASPLGTDAHSSSVDGTSPPSRGSAPEREQGDDRESTGFPVTIEHKFGETTIDAAPERVVSIGYNEHDFLLSLGVTPVGLRDWYGDYEHGVWPWAQDELGDSEPVVLSSDALNFEEIAALDPDVIVGVWSGMTEQDYGLLSDIAPTVAQPDEFADFGTPWQEQTRILGTAVGKVDEADAVVGGVEEQIAAVREAQPEWEGMTAGVAFVIEGGLGVYATQDTRSRFLADLGFTIPDEFDAGGEFFLEVSPEDLSPLDVDVLVWVAGSQEGLDAIVTEIPTRSSLVAVREGREVFASIEVGGAFSHSSPLSLKFVLEALVPELERAADGDPSTVVPSAVEVGAVDAVPAEEASAAFSKVFDSTVPFDDKAANLENADELAPTFDAYSDQTGSISLVDGERVVSEQEFCSFMASARVSCDE